MSAVTVTVDDSRVQIGLSRMQLALVQNEELMKEIGGYMLGSIRRTFREGGSPAGSWVPLAPSTLKKKGYGAGHKLLIQSGRLLNSIQASASPGQVTIGTNLVYAPPHQFGSRDRGGVAIGPVSEEASKQSVKVAAGSYRRRQAELGVGFIGRQRRRIQGPRNATLVNRRAHSRQQNIPPRPYLVFRPEDPNGIRRLVVGYINRAKQAAGFGGGQ